jgi:hypothetical protein
MAKTRASKKNNSFFWMFLKGFVCVYFSGLYYQIFLGLPEPISASGRRLMTSQN